MPNVFKSVLHLGEQSVTQPFRSVKTAIKGNPKKAVTDLFHSASGAGTDVAHSFGIRGWVGDHPMQSVAAIVATIFGGWAAWGAYGGGAAGGAAGSSAMAYAPTASTALGGAGSAGTGSALTYGGSMAGNAVAATGGTWGVGAGGSVGLSGAATTGGISGAGVGTSSMAFAAPQAGSAMAYMPTQSTVLGGTGSGGYTGGSSWMDQAQQYGRRYQNSQQKQQQNQKQKQKQQQNQKQQPISNDHSMLDALMRGGNNSVSAPSVQQSVDPSLYALHINNVQFKGSDFSNQFGG